MQLKATVLADLDRLEKSRPTKPKIAPVRDADANHQKTGNGAAYSATVGRNTKSFLCKPQAQSSRYRWSLPRGLQAINPRRKGGRVRTVISIGWGRAPAIRPQEIASSSRRVPSCFVQSRGGPSSLIDPADQPRPSGASPRPAPRLLRILDRAKASAIGDK